MCEPAKARPYDAPLRRKSGISERLEKNMFIASAGSKLMPHGAFSSPDINYGCDQHHCYRSHQRAAILISMPRQLLYAG
jgi:hypothetical protein